jgi:hypothetical protein
LYRSYPLKIRYAGTMTAGGSSSLLRVGIGAMVGAMVGVRLRVRLRVIEEEEGHSVRRRHSALTAR